MDAVDVAEATAVALALTTAALVAETDAAGGITMIPPGTPGFDRVLPYYHALLVAQADRAAAVEAFHRLEAKGCAADDAYLLRLSVATARAPPAMATPPAAPAGLGAALSGVPVPAAAAPAGSVPDGGGNAIELAPRWPDRARARSGCPADESQLSAPPACLGPLGVRVCRLRGGCGTSDE